MRVHYRLLALLLSLLLAAVTAGCAQRSGEDRPTASTVEPSWVSAGLRTELPAGSSVGAEILTVERVDPPAEQSTAVLITGRTARDSVRQLAVWEVASGGGRGAWRLVPVDNAGRLAATFEYAQVDRGEVALYDMAIFAGRVVYLDLDRGRWTDREGGRFRPIERWSAP